MLTAIVTYQADTPLDIIISDEEQEVVSLFEMGREQTPVELSRGVNSVRLGVGVFRILSEHGVVVAATQPKFTAWVAATTRNKDGTFPDTARLVGQNQAAIARFFGSVTAKEET